MQLPSRFPAPARCWLVHALLAIFVIAGCASAPSVETRAPVPSTVVASPTPAVSGEVEHSQKFARWVAEFSTTARAAGVDEATIQAAFDNVRLVPRVIESDRAQPSAALLQLAAVGAAAMVAKAAPRPLPRPTRCVIKWCWDGTRSH